MDILPKIKYKILEEGASAFGTSFLPESIQNELPEYIRGLGTAITIAVRLSDAIVDGITDKPTYSYFHHYRTVNAFIDQLTLKCMLMLQGNGIRAFAVAASQTVNDAAEPHMAVFPHKTAAVAAGLGFIGKNGLFVSYDFGPRVRLGTVLTNLPVSEHYNVVDIKGTNNQSSTEYQESSCGQDHIEYQESSCGQDHIEYQESSCGQCRICVDSCPALALTGNEYFLGCDRSHLIDVNACSSYMCSAFKHIGRGAVCGICMKVCPSGTLRRNAQK